MNFLYASQKKKNYFQKLVHSIRTHWILYLFVLPVTVFYIIFVYYPMYGVQIAFQNYRLGEAFGESEWVGFKHFIRFINSYWFSKVVWNTVKLSILSLVLGFPLPIILALLLNEVQNLKFRKLVQTITYAPHFISLVVLCGAIQLFLSPSTGLLGGIINAIRTMLGLPEVNLLLNGPAFKRIYVLSGIWQGTGWASIIYFAALSGVDSQLLEAAEIDGANKLQKIWYVNLPVLVPTIITLLILQSGSLLNTSFDKVFLLQNDSIISATETINTYVYRAGLPGGQFSFAAAVGLLNNVVNAFILIMVNQITRWINKENSMF